MNNNIYKEVVYNSPTGYAYLKIVCDEQGSPIDYVFLDVNDSFEKYTGLKASSVLEKRVTEVIPGIKDDEIDWISKYGKVALSEELIEFDQYSTALKRHYRIKAFSPKKGYFITLFSDISAYTKMEQQIGYEQVLVQKYLDTANIMFLVLEHGETIKSINKKGCEILGLEEKDLLGKNWFDNFIPKHLVSQVKNVFVKIINNEIENVEFFENSIITANGDERIISWHNTILRDETGNVISMLSSGNDITDQKNAEKDLMESEEKFKYTFENSPIGKSFTKPSGEINPNKTLCKMLAYTKKELKGIKWLNIIHPDDIEANQKKIDTVLNGGKNSASVITRFIKKNGSILWADVRTSLRRDAEEKPLYFMTNVIDITEQRKSEKSLRQSERRLKAAQNMAKVGNWEIDLETKKMWASEEAYNIYGIQNTAEPISLDFVQSLVLSEYRELLNLKLGNLISKKEKYNIEFKIRSNKTGEVKFVYSKADLELDEKGNAIKVIGTIQDITKRKKMESERESTQSILVNHQKLESIGTLASGVAHEINNPINGILFLLARFDQELCIDRDHAS